MNHLLRRLGSTPAARWLLGLAGVILLIAGVVAVFASSNGAGTAALLGIGGALLFVALMTESLESLDVAGMGRFTFRDVAKQAAASEVRMSKSPDSGTVAKALSAPADIGRLAERYRELRTRASGSDRTDAMEELVSDARELAETTQFDPVDVMRWFEHGTPEVRVMALGLMQGDARLQRPAAVIGAVNQGHSRFEQYQGLRLASMMLDSGTLSGPDAADVAGTIRRLLVRENLGERSDRGRLGQQVLRRIAASDQAAEEIGPA